MDMSIRQIRAFITVARLGSFTRAAAALHLSQPALTVQIRNLETTLATRLLDRNSRGVELTRLGRDLLPTLQKTLADLDAVLADARDLGGTRRGVVRIAALPSFAASVLPDLILQSTEAEPGLRFIVKDAVASAVNALVRSEAVDIGLTGGPFDPDEFDILKRARDRLCLVYRRGHPIGARRRIGIKDLAALPLVLTAAGTSVRDVVDSAFAQARIVPVITCEPIYMMTAVAMVRAGLGATILPGSSPEIRAEPTLESRPIDDPGFVRQVSLIRKKGRTLPPAAAAFAAVLAHALVR